MLYKMNSSADSERNISQPWENILAASTIGILSLITFTAYTLVIVVILRDLRTFARNSYYSLLISLAFSDCIMLALFLFYSVPCTLLQKRIFGDNFDIAMGVICNIAYFAGLMCMSMIAINRYWGVCRYYSYNRVYRSSNVIALLWLIWLFGIGSGLLQAFPCCYLRYFYDAYTYGYDMDLWGNAYYIWYDRSVNTVTFATIIICYSLIIAKKPSQPGTTGRTNNPINNGQGRQASLEQRLALQSGIIAFILIIFGLSFTIIPEVTSNKWFMLLTSVLYIFNNGCNPFIYLIFNRTIRQRFQALLSRRRVCNETTVVPLDRARPTVAQTSSNIEMEVRD